MLTLILTLTLIAKRIQSDSKADNFKWLHFVFQRERGTIISRPFCLHSFHYSPLYWKSFSENNLSEQTLLFNSSSVQRSASSVQTVWLAKWLCWTESAHLTNKEAPKSDLLKFVQESKRLDDSKCLDVYSRSLFEISIRDPLKILTKVLMFRP